MSAIRFLATSNAGLTKNAFSYSEIIPALHGDNAIHTDFGLDYQVRYDTVISHRAIPSDRTRNKYIEVNGWELDKSKDFEFE
jgi:hypothetical protein